MPDGAHPDSGFCAALFLCYECVAEHVRVDGRHSQQRKREADVSVWVCGCTLIAGNPHFSGCD